MHYLNLWNYTFRCTKKDIHLNCPTSRFVRNKQIQRPMRCVKFQRTHFEEIYTQIWIYLNFGEK